MLLYFKCDCHGLTSPNQSLKASKIVQAYQEVRQRLISENSTISLDNLKQHSNGSYTCKIKDNTTTDTMTFNKDGCYLSKYSAEKFKVLLDIAIRRSEDPSKLKLTGKFPSSEAKAEAQKLLDDMVQQYQQQHAPSSPSLR